MKVFIHEYGMALLSMLMCVFLTVTASPVSIQIQGAMTDVINQATDVANFGDLEITVDETIGMYNGKKVTKAELSCSKTTNNDDLSAQKNLFTVTVTYLDNTSEEIPAADIISINKIKEDNSGITYTATIKGEKKNFNTSELTIDKITPIYAGYNPNDTTLYFANTEQEIEDAGVDLSRTNYYGNISNNCNYKQGNSPWFSKRSSITNINILSEIKPTSCSFWFKEFGITNTKTLKNLNTKNCTNMTSMFESCSNLISIDLSNFNTGNVSNMWGMFKNCNKLQNIDLNNFNTSNVTNMGSIFENCSSLESIDLSHLDTYNVKDFGRMFANCNFVSLDLKSLDTYNATSFSAMFKGCRKLKSLDLSTFDTSNLTDVGDMFVYCDSLESLNVSNWKNTKLTRTKLLFKIPSLKTLKLDNFKTDNIKVFDSMFESCQFTSIDLSSFNTNNATSMLGMFKNCNKLQNINLSNFNTSNVTNISSMFENCNSLSAIDVSSFNTNKINSMDRTFYGCSVLDLLNLGNFNTDKVTNKNNVFTNVSSNIKIYTISQDTKDWILELDNLPSTLVSDCIILGTPE